MMGRMVEGEEEEAGLEPVTPAGRFFIQPNMQNIIHCVVGGRLPADIDAFKLAFKDTFLPHPRFCSLMVRDKRGRERWKKTEVDLDKHLIFPTFADRPELDDDDFVNRYLAELAVSAPLDEAKPLWEVHVMESRRICVIRLHASPSCRSSWPAATSPASPAAGLSCHGLGRRRRGRGGRGVGGWWRWCGGAWCTL